MGAGNQLCPSQITLGQHLSYLAAEMSLAAIADFYVAPALVYLLA